MKNTIVQYLRAPSLPIGVAMLLLLLPLTASAQHDTTGLGNVRTLPQVRVRSHHERSFQKLSSVEQSEVITADGLKGLACCNLGESFENSASVEVGYSDAVSGSKQIQLLGLTGIYSQMMLENIPMLRGIAAPYGLGFVPGQWLESIAVSKGAGTVKNGYESITGTINLEYEKPHRGNRLTVNLYGNSDGKGELTAKTNWQLSDRLSTGLYLYGAHHFLSADHLPHDGHGGRDGYRDFPLQTQLNLVNRWNYEGDNGFRSITLFNYIHDERLGGDMRFVKEMRGNDSIYGFGGTIDRIHVFTKNGKSLSDKVSIGTQLSASHTQQESFYGLNTYRSREGDLYANVLVDAEVGAFSNISSGASMRYSDMREDLYSHPYLGSQPFSNDTLGWGSLTELLPGLFGEYTLKLGTIFTTTVGLRYDYNSAFHRHLLTPRLHLRWEPIETFIIRASLGRGFRTANVVADNIGMLASSRTIHVAGPIDLEESWNGGINFNKTFEIGDERKLRITADIYHTEFVSQLVADYDQDPNQVWLYNLQGRSFSDVAQVDLNVEPIRNFEITLAGKLNNVKSTYHGVLMDKPYTSKWRALLVLTYHTAFEKWRFDLTTQLNGPQRLPLNVSSHNGYTTPYIYMLGQITRKMKRSEIYVGVENLTNYTQHHPIAGYDQPFTTHFDASVVYAPLMGRLFYVGFRYNVR